MKGELQMRVRGADDNEALGEEGHFGIELVLGKGTHLNMDSLFHYAESETDPHSHIISLLPP